MGVKVAVIAIVVLCACSQPEQPQSLGVLDVAFTDPLIDGTLLYEPIANADQLSSQIDSIAIYADYFTAYDNVNVTNIESGNGLYVVNFAINGQSRDAYAYAITDYYDCATLIIPGSGHNQAYEIVDGGGYHGDIVRVMGGLCDVFVMIKPNEGIRAIHDGEGKLSYDFVTNRLLMLGSGYSQSYLIEAMAIAKSLGDYDNLAILGLSQGGYAAMLVSLQAKPDIAIVSSGWSVQHQSLYWTGDNQIVIPELQKRYTIEAMAEMMSVSKTEWLFTYGALEPGFYGNEASGDISTCDHLPNATCYIHDGGHVFPDDAIMDFINGLR